MSKASDVAAYFSMLSLGNIGEDNYACGESNLAIESNITLACSYGRLSSLVAYGISIDKKSSCKDMEDPTTLETLSSGGCAVWFPSDDASS